MAKYTVVVKRGDFQYSVTGENREFLTSHIHMLFSELKTRAPKEFDIVSSKLDVEKSDSTEKQISEPKNSEQRPYHSVPENICVEDETERQSAQNPFEPHASEQFSPEIKEHGGIGSDNEDFKIAEQAFLQDESEEMIKPQLSDENESAEADSYSDVSEAQFSDFENILEEKIKNPPIIEAAESQEAAIDYETLIRTKSTGSMTDYLVITAYFMLENENTERFALKQLNQKLFSSMKLLVDNKTAQKAVEDGLIQVVSGFSEAGVTEYALTEYGRDYYINGFQ